MMRLFLRIFYMTFLWIILLANLMIAFNLTTTLTSFGQGLGYDIDFTGKYVGVSNLIDMLKHIDDYAIGGVVGSVGSFQKSVYATGSEMLSRGIQEIQFNSDAVTTSTDVIQWLKNVILVLGNIFTIIGAVFTYLFGLIVLIFYYLMLLLSLVYTILFWISGLSSTSLPSTVHPVTVSVGNCITPLLTAV